jgi:hypothetical protein
VQILPADKSGDAKATKQWVEVFSVAARGWPCGIA